MSISAIPGAVITAAHKQASDRQSTQKIYPEQNQCRKLRFTLHFSPLWICLLIALALRIWLIVRTHGVIDGDEAMVGIQAEHILRGESPLPLYFYGQPYMGSLEAYLTAILFKIAGPSVWALRAEPTLLSLVVVWLTEKMAKALANAAQLPTRATQLFITTTLLFAAVSPAYDTVLELHTLGGYIETFTLMLFLLLSTFQLTQRWHQGASRKELTSRWAGIGFIVGLGLWVDPLIASAIVTAALWVIGYYVSEIVRRKNCKKHAPCEYPGLCPYFSTHMKKLLLALVAIPALLPGAFPAILWGLNYHWANVTYLLQIGNQPQNLTFQQQYPTRLDIIRGMVWFYSNIMTPRLIGGALPGEDTISSALHTGTTITGLLCIFITLALLMNSFFSRHPQLQCMRQLAALPLLFALCSATIFCTSPLASAALLSPQHDLAGRYATPFMLVLPFFFATAITGLALWVNIRSGENKSSFMRALSGSRDGRDKSGLMGNGGHDTSVPTYIAQVAQGILLVLLLITVGIQAASYGMVNPAATFQSPSCPIAPANDDPIISYLQQEHVHYAWAVPWIGNPIIFKTNDGIITADPRPIINFKGLTRINAYLQDVSNANEPALLAFVPHDDPYPLLLWILNTRHITYRAAFFPSEPGIDVLVVTRLSRSLSLYESKYLSDVFGNCI
ncbi:MAG: hypothetical protein ABI406_10185 [Ktedonobacteraceae bacterium]